MKHFIFSLFLILFMTSCREPKDLVFKDFQNLKIERLGFAGAKLTLDLIYYNPNNFGLQLNRTDLDIFVDSTLLGHSLQDVQINIPRRENFTVPLAIDLDMKNLLKNGLSAAFKKDVKVRLLGKVKVGKGGVYKTFNVDYTSIQNFSLFR